MENYLIAMLAFAGLYGLMALGLNIMFGLAGLVNLGLVGFVAVGAYASALVTVRLGWPMPLGWVFGAVLAGLAGAIVSLAVARLQGDYLAIVTLGFAEVVRLVASNEIWLTNGTDGISGIPGPWRGVLTPGQFNLLFCAIAWAAVALVAFFAQRLSTSPFGRVLRAIRQDEMVAAVAGKRVLAFKVKAFALGAAVLGLAGALYGHFNAFIAPDAFQALLTIYVILALTAGGTGRVAGAVLGAVLLVTVMEGTRFLAHAVPGLTPVQGAAVREMAVGLLLILVLRLRPQGLLPERVPRLREPA